MDYAVGGVVDTEYRGEPDSTARLQADRRFLYGMLRDAWRTSWWKAIFYVKAAWIYYRAVRAAGQPVFKIREPDEEVTVERLLKEAG